MFKKVRVNEGHIEWLRSQAQFCRLADFWSLIAVALITGLALAGCATRPPIQPVDLASAGWNTRQGQAVWLSEYGATPIAGDLILATHTSGQTWIEFAKGPLFRITAQTTTNQWRLEMNMAGRRRAVNGPLPGKAIWFTLVDRLSNASPSPDWQWQVNPDGNWTLMRRDIGESLSGFLSP